jgi:AraC-like DNA-binding protein
LSARRFTRLFTLQVGLTPKLFARIQRFQHTLEATQGPAARDWTVVAHECGYFDQSHLIRECRELSGFTPMKVGDVVVGLGEVKKVDFTLTVAGVAESVSVTAESPLVDVRQSARQTNIRREQIEMLPKGPGFTTLVTQVAGANDEGRLGGLSIDGASASENRYIIDGIETTDLKEGISGKSVIADFVDEVQVKSSGYTAEFGGATGGVINVVTRSGQNDFHGEAKFDFANDALQGTPNPTLRLNDFDPGIAEYYAPDNLEPAYSLYAPSLSLSYRTPCGCIERG